MPRAAAGDPRRTEEEVRAHVRMKRSDGEEGTDGEDARNKRKRNQTERAVWGA